MSKAKRLLEEQAERSNLEHFLAGEHDALAVNVPPEVRLCPYCGSPLIIESIDESQEIDNRWVPTSISIECTSEPTLDSEEAWDEWNLSHSDMPYVHWLPAEMAVLEWLQKVQRGEA